MVMVKVLIVDDSASMRMFLEGVFEAAPGLKVVGTAENGEDALHAAERLAPDVITMDINMPLLNGLEATRRIMETRPVPIVVLSGVLDTEEIVSSFRAMEAGAVAALPKPRGAGHPEHEREVRELIQTVRLMAEIRVVRRWPRQRRGTPPSLPEAGPVRLPTQVRAVAIGASTGGPVAIQTILSGLARNFPVPVLIVQHMAKGFVGGFAEWLALTSSLHVRIASHNERLLPGHAYLAPDDRHMLVEPGDRIALGDDLPENGLRPSVSALFRSIDAVYGQNAAGVLLTGMGSDGVAELLSMKNKGAVTIAQDRASCVVFGMPGEAVRLGAATYTLPPDRIAATLAKLTAG
jgi:two-component system, chemotaxis family, protein-glutamate methylesterase/glutaminase